MIRPEGSWRVAAMSLAGLLLLATTGLARTAYGGGPERVAAPGRTATLVWHDEFTGPAGSAPSAKNWTTRVGGGGWGNAELECYTSDRRNSSLNGKGDLVISALRQPGHSCAGGTTNSYTSARLDTQDKVELRYGRIEIRAKVPAGRGTWPSFWAIGANEPQVKWPRSGEFDILEAIGRRPTMLKTTVHSVDAKGRHDAVTREATAKKPLSAAWHVFAISWTSSGFTSTFDGHVYSRISRADARRTGMTWVFDKPFYFVLNLALGGGYAGPMASGTVRKDFLVDWIRVYRS